MQNKPQQKIIAVAVDKDKGSYAALKWTVDTICLKGQTLLLIHVKLKPPGTFLNPPLMLNQNDNSQGSGYNKLDAHTRELFLNFRGVSRKNIKYVEIVLEDTDVAKALIKYVNLAAIEVLVLSAAVKGGFFRFKAKDIPAHVGRGVPDFCSVYVLSKGNISTTRSASRKAPENNPLRNQILNRIDSSSTGCDSPSYPKNGRGSGASNPRKTPRGRNSDSTNMKSPFGSRRGADGKLYVLPPPPESDISFVSSSRPSASNFDDFEDGLNPPRLSGYSDLDRTSFQSADLDFRSSTPPKCPRNNSRSHNADVETEVRRLKEQLDKTMEMYSAVCKEALTAKKEASELQNWRDGELKKNEASKLAGEEALALVKKEKVKSKEALEVTEASDNTARLELQKRLEAEKNELKKAEKKNNVHSKVISSNTSCRKYTIDEIEIATDYFSKSRKIGEGGYGPVFKCNLDHTPVAVKVLSPGAAEGRLQFQQEVEVLSCIRHPNMVLLLGACPEYGCLVYEYLSNGSLEDRLMQRGNTRPLSWQHRFRIAAEITRALLFLHNTKPDPIVHRDLKPANILLDSHLVSKISDVGLARLVPAAVVDTVTQYRMTSAAGTFCYIDPEYQTTGMLGTKSDVFSLGIIFLQMLTANPPMGLTYYVEKAIEHGNFDQMLDPSVDDWPIEDALRLAKLALKCSQIRRKDRPDLAKDVMPELERLKILAEENSSSVWDSGVHSRNRSQISLSSGDSSYPTRSLSGYNSSRSQFSISSIGLAEKN